MTIFMLDTSDFLLLSQHPIVPSAYQVKEVTHVALAFMNSAIFNEPERTEWPLFTTVEETRQKFAPGTKVMVAIGGWGDTEGFSVAAESDDTRKLWARNVAKMVEATGADGMFLSLDMTEQEHRADHTHRSRRRLGVPRVSIVALITPLIHTH